MPKSDTIMNVPYSVAELQKNHVLFELEGIDRLYLNAYVPKLTNEAGVASYFRHHLGHRFASTKQAAHITAGFITAIRQFIKDNDIPLIRFKKGQRKDDVFKKHLRSFKGKEGVVFIGVAQEKNRVPRTVRKTFGEGGTIPWIDYTTAMVNVYYFYCLDEDFGPFFLKFCSYFPYAAKLCLNGHEYLKCQLSKRGIGFEALDNGLLSCEDLAAAQRICDGLSPAKIDRFFRKWLRILPHPYCAKDRKAGYRYKLSILQAEFSLTQVWNRGLNGRRFFEEVIRENIDLGRPEQVQLIFARRVPRKSATDGRFRTRIITEGVVPSLHVYYKNTHLKQYHKEGRALRTETTINDTYDFGVGRLIKNLPALRKIGFAANRRVLEVERISHDCNVGIEAFEKMQQRIEVEGQRASALRFGDARVQALLATVMLFCLQPRGFTNKELRPLLAQYLGKAIEEITPGKMTYDLRRMRLHGLIERKPGTQRYQLTSYGLKTALFYSRTYNRVLRPGMSTIADEKNPSKLRRAYQSFENELDRYFSAQRAA